MKISLQDCINLINIVIEPLFSDLASHLRREAFIAYTVAHEMGLNDNQVKHVFIAASIHDISILLKSTRSLSLTDSDILNNYAINGQEVEREIRILNRISNVFQDTAMAFSDYIVDELVYFSGAFELYLRDQDKDYISYSETLLDTFFGTHPEFSQRLTDAARRLSKNDIFWLRLESKSMFEAKQSFSPLKDILVTMKDLNEICLFLARIVDKHSSFTVMHSTSVGRVAARLGMLMQLPEVEQNKIRVAGYLHDIGKIYIPTDILNKEGPLTYRERALMKKHSFMTMEMLSVIDSFKEITPWAANHHERLDGSGYPFGLSADEQDLPSRIIAVADMFTALIEHRPYRRGMPAQAAMRILQEDANRGKLDIAIVTRLAASAESVIECVGLMLTD